MAAQGQFRDLDVPVQRRGVDVDRDGARGTGSGTGILSTAYVKDPDDPASKDDAGVKDWHAFMTKYMPEADQHDTNFVNSYNSGWRSRRS